MVWLIPATREPLGNPMKSRITKLVIAVAIAALGIAAAIYADADDAPGGVLLGMLLVLGAAVLGVRAISAGNRDGPRASR